MNKAKTVDEYIDHAPSEVQERLKQIRNTIREAAPDASEKISYSMPYCDYKGRLVYYAYFKNHIGLYIPPPVIAQHKKALKGYQTSEATVKFPLDKALPLDLVRQLVKSRAALNDEISDR